MLFCREEDVSHGSSSKSYCIYSVEALSLSNIGLKYSSYKTLLKYSSVLKILSQGNVEPYFNLSSYAREYNQVFKNRMKSLFRCRTRFSKCHDSSSFFSSSSQLERSYQRFTAFYASRHSGRKLTWLYHLSKGELVTNCFKNRYTLQVRQCCVKLWCRIEAACAWKH